MKSSPSIRPLIVATAFSRPGDLCRIEFFFIDNATDSRRKRGSCSRSRRLRLAAVSDRGYRGVLERRLLLLCGRGLGCRAGLFDFRHDFAYFYFLTFGRFGFEHAVSFSNDFGRNFVGLESEERVAFFYLLA